MGLIAYLKPYQSVLIETRISSFLGLAKLVGKFKDYNATLGIVRIEKGSKFGWVVFYRIALKSRVKVPLYIWDKCPIENNENMNLYSGRLLALEDFVPENPFSDIKIDSYFSSQNNESISNKFLRLVEIAQELENNQMTLVKAFEKEKKKFIRNIFIAITILIIWYCVYFIIGRL